jgi:CubicO group peptidase (beta-lactamase class C family)
MDAGRRFFLGQLGTAAIVTGLDCGLPAWAFAASDATSPESLGVSSMAVRAFLDAAAASSSQELHSILVARKGQIAARGWWAPYRAAAPHSLYSLSKSFTSTAVGFAVTDGKLKLSDKVVEFFPQQAPAQISENLATLRVEHLLTMSVGHPSDSTPLVTREQDWIKTFLAQPIPFEPGSAFVYDSAATYMLSAIVQKVTGEKVVDYLGPRLFDPLGMPTMRWAECPRGVNTGGWGLFATTESIFKFGQFYLQKGQWNGRQLLPREWIEQATTFKIQQPSANGQDLEQLKPVSDWHQGYAYQFWRCRHDAFRGDGAFGQYCVVLPKLDAVIAITGRTLDLQGTLNLVWDHLLPGIHDAALPADRNASDRLRTQLAGLMLQPPDGASSSPRQGRRFEYAVEPNALGVQRLAVAFGADACRVAFDVGDRTHAITSGIGRWRDGETELPGTPPEFTELTGRTVNPKGPARLAAAGAWKDADTFQMQWRYYETPHFDTVTLKFAGDGVEVAFLNSLTQMAAAVHAETRPTLKGTARS